MESDSIRCVNRIVKHICMFSSCSYRQDAIIFLNSWRKWLVFLHSFSFMHFWNCNALLDILQWILCIFTHLNAPWSCWKLIGRCKKSRGIIFYFPLQAKKREGGKKRRKKKGNFWFWQTSFEPFLILLTYRFIPCGGLFRV